MAEPNGQPDDAGDEPQVAEQLVCQIMENGEVRVSAPDDEGAALQMVEAARLHIYERRIMSRLQMMAAGKGPDELVRPGQGDLEMFSGGPQGRA